MTGNGPLLSVIVPTYNEKGNMALLIPAVCRVLNESRIPFEVLVMDDDSPDGTAKEVRRLAEDHPEARVVVRKEERGLSPAVIEGFNEARGRIYLVMDADLSHPIEALPEMYRAITEGGADIVVGSRHTMGGGIVDWPLHRKVISWGASSLARPLTRCSDPMSGFFAVRPEVVEGAPLRPRGYKILLEVLVKGKYERVEEVPITFRDREVGESKLGTGVIFNYLRHLFSLYMFPGSAPLLKFLLVGGSGMIIDLALAWALVSVLGDNTFDLLGWEDIRFFYLFQTVSFLYAVTWNFVLNRYWTFDARAGKSGEQYVKFFTVAVFALILRSFLMVILVEHLGFSGVPLYQLAQVVVIVIVTVLNFLGSRFWAFRK